MKLLLLLIFIIYSFSAVDSAQLVISKFSTAQTHIIPDTGLTWNSGAQNLRLVGTRDTLFIVELGVTTLVNPIVQGLLNSKTLGPISLNPPSQLPTTESNGTPFSTTAYSVLLPASWIQPGVQIRVSADTYTASDYKTLDVGCDTEMDLYILPFYLFGANDTNSKNFSTTSAIPSANEDELFNKWPVSNLNVQNSPVKRVDWPFLILEPNGTHPAIKVTNKDQQRDGFEIMGYILSYLSGIRSVNGISSMNNQYYAPIIWLNAAGASVGTGGGLGSVGGSTGTGDTSFTGIFIHEQGHAFGLPHATDSYNAGKYPYVNGSLLGSAWGYDKTHNQFLTNQMPTEASNYKYCTTTTNYVDNPAGDCMKQTVMQGGSGCQSKGYIYSMFADYECGVMQKYFEGNTTISNGTHIYNGGKIFKDNSFPSGFSRWDTIDKKYVEYIPTTTSGALYGFNGGFPSVTNVPVFTIFATVSLAGTKDANQVYPPLYYTGNLLTYIDPTNSTQLAMITPNKGANYWYCHASGCDFTIRVTYPDNSTTHILTQSGLRSWFSINGTINPDFYNPNNSGSLRTFAFNVPASKVFSRVQIFFTPNGYVGFPKNPQLLLDFACSGPKEKLTCSQYVAPSPTNNLTDSSDISSTVKLTINSLLIISIFFIILF